MASKGDTASRAASIATEPRVGYWRGVFASLALAGIVALGSAQRLRRRQHSPAKKRKEVWPTSQDRHRDPV